MHVIGSLGLVLLASEESVDGGRQLVPSMEELEFEEENEAHQVTAHALNEFTSSIGRTACILISGEMSELVREHTSSDDVVNDDHLLARLDRIGLHLEEVGSILLLVALGVARTGELALLADGDKASAQAQSQAGSHQEATGLQADDHIGLLVAVALEDVQLQAAE